MNMVNIARNFFHTTSAMKRTGMISHQRLKDPKERLNKLETPQTEVSSALTGLMMNHFRYMVIIRAKTGNLLK